MGEGGLDVGELGDGVAEAAAADELFFVGWGVFELEAGGAVEFFLGAFDGDTKVFADLGVGCAGEVTCAVYAELFELFADALSYAPYCAGRLAVEGAFLDGWTPVVPVDDAFECGVAFGEVVAVFCECFGGGDADAGGDADPLEDSLADLVAEWGEGVRRQAVQVGEAFVYGVDFDGWDEGGDAVHHAA